MDFACGSGSLLLNVRKRMGSHGIGKIYGQEKNIQSRENGTFLDTFVGRVKAVMARHRIPQWKIADAAKISRGFLGNAIRYPAPINTVNISTAFASRLAAVVEALEWAQSDEEVAAVLNPGTKAAAPAAVDAAPSTQRGDSADERGGGHTIDDLIAIMRRLRIQSIALEPAERVQPHTVREVV
jgi:hypothetical protein